MISFVIPVYKTPLQLLRNCLDSVLRYSQPMELICVLDSPGDACEAVLDEYALREPRIRLLKNDRNRGVSYSRNRGVDAARGAWLAFVDADDEIIAETYEKAVDVVEREHLNACAVSTDPDCGAVCGTDYGKLLVSNLKDVENGVNVASAFCWVVFSMIVRRDVWKSSVGAFVVGHRFCEDYMAVVKLLCTDGNFGFLNLRGYKGVGHPESTCRAGKCTDRYTHSLRAIKSVIRDVVAYGVSPMAMRWYLQHTIPLGLFDPDVRHYVKGDDRKGYLVELQEMMVILEMACFNHLTFLSRVFVLIVQRVPATWFLPGMPILFGIRALSHFNLMLKRTY